MIYLGVKELILGCSHFRGKKLTISEIAERTGIARKTISYLVNHPTDNISVHHLATLAEFFFKEYINFPNRELDQTQPKRHKKIMEEVISTLFQVYPDDPTYRDVVPDFVKATMTPEAITANLMWGFYEAKFQPQYSSERVVGLIDRVEEILKRPKHKERESK